MGINTQPSGATSLSQTVNGPDAALDVEYRTDPVTGAPIIVGDAAGVAVRSGVLALRRKSSGHTRFVAAARAATPTATANTFGLQTAAPAPFYAVRLRLTNHNEAGTLDVTSCRVAASPTHLNDGSALTTAQVTFGGSATATIPAASGTGVNTVPGVLVSDTIYVASVPRTDDPTKKPLLHARVYLPIGAVVQQETSSARSLSQFNGISNGVQLGFFANSGDHNASTWTARTMSETGGYFSAGVEIEFLCTAPVTTIAGVGDSLEKGANSSAYSYGMLQQAAMLLDSPATPTTAAVWAMSGQTTVATLATLQVLLADTTWRPTYCVIAPWSPNDSASTDTIMNTSWTAFMTMVKALQDAGITPVARTCPPQNSLDATQNLRRVAQNNRLVGLRGATNLIIADIAPGMEDPANPGKLLPAFDADGLHYNDPGHRYPAGVIVEAIRRGN